MLQPVRGCNIYRMVITRTDLGLIGCAGIESIGHPVPIRYLGLYVLRREGGGETEKEAVVSVGRFVSGAY